MSLKLPYGTKITSGVKINELPVIFEEDPVKTVLRKKLQVDGFQAKLENDEEIEILVRGGN